MESLEIKLLGTREIHFCDSPVRGYVVANVKTPSIAAAALEIEFSGTYWFRNALGKYQSEIFASYRQDLYLNGVVGGFECGKYESPFAFFLEPTFPSSVACAGGSVQYKLVARCTYKLASCLATDHTIEETKYLSVIQLLDVEKLAVAHLGAIARQSGGNSWVTCCWRNSLDLYLRTKRRAYVCGEYILASVSIPNMTEIDDVELRLVQVVETILNRRYKTIISSKQLTYRPQRAAGWHDEQLRVPALPPSTFDKNMTISYCLELEAKRIRSYTASITLTIGSKPLEDLSIDSVILEKSFVFPGTVNLKEEAYAFIPSYPVYNFTDNSGNPSACAETDV
ncbi:Arrestin domain containing [Nesidiocoris tenuis]|uniref:Arrestin domain containing n=1 Tax=Nesidiocoris tenuis TaxID=355587 RepID=A0ABN7ATM0_9HEMI|nr:Arrestin domain containing [Nesidiocoris tenuis]